MMWNLPAVIFGVVCMAVGGGNGHRPSPTRASFAGWHTQLGRDVAAMGFVSPPPRAALRDGAPGMRDEARARVSIDNGEPGRAVDDADGSASIEFAAFDVVIDSGDTALAAYQVAIASPSSDIVFVGVEGGEHEAFADPPYYDPDAMMHEQLIIAAFDVGDDLPTGRTRVARIHVQITGDVDADFATELVVAATSGGTPIDATITLQAGDEE